MKHYRQIIIDLAIEDDTPEDKIESFKDELKEFVEGKVNRNITEVINVKVN